MAAKHSFMWLLLCTLPVSFIMWLGNAFLSTITGVDAINPIRWLSATIIPIFVAKWGLQRKSLSFSGAVTGLIVGFILTLSSYIFTVNLFVFFISSSKATKFRSQVKRKFEEDYKEGGERNWVQVLCNGGVATLMAWLHIVDCGCGEKPVDLIYNYRCSWLNIAVLGALACCNGDTWASEYGSVLSIGEPFLITSFRPVPRGTNGGVSTIGLVVSLIGGLIIGLGHYISILMSLSSSVLIDAPPQWPIILVGALGGLLGSLIDSLIGATMQFSGVDSKGRIVERPGEGIIPISGSYLLDNHAVNLISSLITALILPSVALFVM